MVNSGELKKFLIKANMPHADGSAEITEESDGSRTIVYEHADWQMHDNFFGGEPYGGRQVVFYQNKPVWICVYYGFVDKNLSSAADVYDFLREALRYPPKDMPLRGPAFYEKSNMEYRHAVPDDIENFSSEETITKNGKQIYSAQFVGGMVDQRFKGSI